MVRTRKERERASTAAPATFVVRVLVAGGGVIGLSCAWYLRREGAEVEVLEAGGFGEGASHASAGWIVPSLSTPLAAPGMLATGLRHGLDPRGALVIRPSLDLSWIRWLWRFRAAASRERYERGVRALLGLNGRTMALFDELSAAGVEFEMHSAGVLALARSREHMSWFIRLFAELDRLGYPGEVRELGGSELRALEPAVAEEVSVGVLTSLDRHVQPDSFVRGLGAALSREGAFLRPHVAVRALRRAGRRWVATTEAGDVVADALVVATGARVNDVLRSVDVRLPVVGAKGYAVELVGEGTVPQHALYLMEPKVGLSPYRGGSVRIAGVFELPGRDDTPSPTRVRHIVEDARAYLRDWTPVGSGWAEKGCAGLRPSTPDSLPFIGPVPGAPGLFVATGHGMLGVTLAPSTGEAVASMVLGRGVAPTLVPFGISRRG